MIAERGMKALHVDREMEKGRGEMRKERWERRDEKGEMGKGKWKKAVKGG